MQNCPYGFGKQEKKCEFRHMYGDEGCQNEKFCKYEIMPPEIEDKTDCENTDCNKCAYRKENHNFCDRQDG
jgi:hypothetical protein